MQTAIETVEKDIRTHREHLGIENAMGMACCGRGELPRRHLEWLDGERERLEERLRTLLDDGEATP